MQLLKFLQSTANDSNLTSPSLEQRETSSKVFRLANGYSSSEGRVEIKIDGSWSTICDDNWGIESANAICNHLGYSGAVESYSYSYFGEGKGRIHILDNSCILSGNFTSGSCSLKSKVKRDCSHANDVGIICFRKH